MKKAECGSCKYYAKGEKSSFCENPKQKDPRFKVYTYYNFTCNLHELGISDSRVKYMKSIKNTNNE